MMKNCICTPTTTAIFETTLSIDRGDYTATVQEDDTTEPSYGPDAPVDADGKDLQS